MKYLSVCSGIEAASVAWHPLGWQPVAFSEIEPFPSAVLAHHYPSVPNWGDMTKFQEWPDETVDLLVGGTPCQSFSVAGLRKGLEDPRGNLMLTYLAIAQRYRPRWLVWENVPGVLSSNGGRDFGTFLGALGELGYGWAYRVLDAQWFGVAQRRRRVFVVGHLGDWQRAAKVFFEQESLRRDTPPSREARQGAAASVGGGPDGGRIAGTVSSKWSKGSGGPAGDECYNMVAQPVAPGSHWDDPRNPHPTLNQSFNTGSIGYGNQELFSQRGGGLVPQPMAFDILGVPAMNGAKETEVHTPLRARMPGQSEASTTTVVAQPVNIYGGNKRADRPEGGFYVRTDEETSKCLDAASGLNPTCSQGGTAVLQPVYGTDCYNGAITGDVAATLGTPGSSVNASGPTVMQPIAFKPGQSAAARSLGAQVDIACTLEGGGGNNKQAIAQPVAFHANAQACQLPGPDRDTSISDSLTRSQQAAVAQPVATGFYPTAGQDFPCLTECSPSVKVGSGGSSGNPPGVQHAMQVRRLTPTECERLQGFPDNYTNIPWRKKPEAPDGPRYKALGNSMAVPCMQWIGKRIAEVDNDPLA